ncbi:MAG: minor capsid protein [Alphaproteobacteria bacterium]|nr:minor capsid protein [Alphaproteobacteria bacterium]
MATIEFHNLPPKEAVAYFERKGYAVSFAWQDVWKEEHARAFTVAKAMRLDILEDIRNATELAIKNGLTFQQFQKQLAPILQAKGWWGKQDMVDPLTGKTRKVQLGSGRRLKTIFDTNMRTSYAAGKWERIQRVKDRRPYLRYIAILDGRTRLQHKTWHGTVLPVDHPFWKTHYPPNGWRCRCTVQQLSDRDLKRFGHEVSPSPAIQTRKWGNPRTGEIMDVPIGIDPGFDYNVGLARDRAFTPPPQGGGLPTSFPTGVNLPPLPAPRPAPAQVLPDGLGDDAYIDAFLDPFGTRRGMPAVHFTDKAGERLVISEDLFRAADGTLKLTKDGRHLYAGLLAAAIREPDEIWWVWEELHNKPGTWILRRRHIARWDLGNGQAPALSVFEHGQDGWTDTTVFAPKASRTVKAQDDYLDRWRGGTLAWRRR